jgi:hypothetical protein
MDAATVYPVGLAAYVHSEIKAHPNKSCFKLFWVVGLVVANVLDKHKGLKETGFKTYPPPPPSPLTKQ